MTTREEPEAVIRKTCDYHEDCNAAEDEAEADGEFTVHMSHGREYWGGFGRRRVTLVFMPGPEVRDDDGQDMREAKQRAEMRWLEAAVRDGMLSRGHLTRSWPDIGAPSRPHDPREA